MKLDDRLEVGSIIFEKVYDTKPPKDKYYIITGFTPDRALLSAVYVNSTINVNLFPTQKLKDLHVQISALDNPFLSYDSFVGCSNIHGENTNSVTGIINSRDPRYGYISTVSNDCLQKIMQTIKSAHTIPPVIKKKYGFI